MKSLKIVLASLFLVGSAIAVSSFTVKNFKSNAFAVVCYDYIANTTKTDLRVAQTTIFIDATEFKTVSNWQQNAADPTTVCEEQNKICRLCFDPALLVGVTFQDLLEDLRTYIATNGKPANGATVNLTVTGTGSAIIPVKVYNQDF